MIYVIAPGTRELVSKRTVLLMRLPLRTGWDGWVFKDNSTGVTKKFRSYRRLKAFLKELK
jgi:hypothetical protein